MSNLLGSRELPPLLDGGTQPAGVGITFSNDRPSQQDFIFFFAAVCLNI
jgi:hypothetical protein